MPQRDYLLRQFEQFGEVLARLLGFKNKGKLDETLEIIDESLIELLKIDSAYLNSLTTDEIINELVGKRYLNVDQLKIAAHLLFEEAEIFFIKENKLNYLPRYHKAMILFEYIEKAEKVFSIELNEKIEKIKLLLSQ